MPVHPAIAARLPLLDGIPSLRIAHADPVLAARLREFEHWPSDGVPVVGTRADTVPGPHGPVPVRIYTPPGSTGGAPVLVWMHGGAFVGGDLDMAESDWTAREISQRADAVVVAVDYRLAVGGVHHPIPLDDVVAATRWTRHHALDLGVDPARLSIGGASAGACLAAGATLRLRDEAAHPAALLMAYPCVHATLPTASVPAAAAIAGTPENLRMSDDDLMMIMRNYLGEHADRPGIAPYAVPGDADVSGLCPTVVVNAEYDTLRVSGEAFAARLAQAGVDVHLVTARGLLHGFLGLPGHLEPVGRVLDLLSSTVVAAGC